MSSAELAPKKYQLFIDGQWVDSESGKTFKTPNPATGATLAEVAEGDKADIDKAVIAARRAFEGKWSKVSARDRGRMLRWAKAGRKSDHAQSKEKRETGSIWSTRTLAGAPTEKLHDPASTLSKVN